MDRRPEDEGCSPGGPEICAGQGSGGKDILAEQRFPLTELQGRQRGEKPGL